MQNTLQSNRRQFIGGALGAAGLVAMPTWAKAIGANDDVRVAVIGFNGRGGGHISSLLAIKGVRITALCDVDQKVMDKKVADFKKKGIEVKQYSDYRKLLEDKDIDAVTIATPNHSHTLIALAALAAGKHVYVEKPVCHNPMEGRKLVEASAIVLARGQILQHGMQRRSSPGWAEAVAFAQSGQIGKVTLSRGINYKARKSIGKTAAPAQPDANGRIAKHLPRYWRWQATRSWMWTTSSGPLHVRPWHPCSREQFHYDWHWQWKYGNGDIGNQGPTPARRRPLGARQSYHCSKARHELRRTLGLHMMTARPPTTSWPSTNTTARPDPV
jgi:hypothetical protein